MRSYDLSPLLRATVGFDRLFSMLDDDEMAWLDEQLRGDCEHLIVGTSLPYLLPRGIHDLEAWNEAIEANRRDRAYATWQQAQGLIPVTAAPLPEVLVEHWPLHLVFLVLPLAFLTWFFRRRYVDAARAYHRGVVRRSKRYALRVAAAC